MHIEVDQSGKVEDLRQDTVVAFSDREQYSVLFPRKLKKEIIYEHRGKIKQLIQRLFAICIFYCLKNYIRSKELITIDLEYTGWEADIKTYLIPLFRSLYKDFDKKIIKFGHIGKKSPAHKIAKSTNQRKIKPNKILTRKEILRYLKCIK